MSQTVIHNLLIILAAGLLAGIVCRRLRVSVLIGYLIVGTLLGDGLLGWVVDAEHQLEVFTEVGVFLLLFTIGLEFSLDDVRKLGSKLLIAGTTQMTLVAAPVALGLLWLGSDWREAWLIAMAISLSSTVLVFKALSEWGHAEKPHGQRAIGILLFQDAALIPLLLMIPLLTGGSQTPDLMDYLRLVLISITFVLAVILVRHLLADWVIPRLTQFRSPELVVLFTIVALGGVTLAAYSVGLPPAVGAFAAGLIFNGNRWTRQIDALVLPFRETFAVIFFVGLGLIFDPRVVWTDPINVLLALLAVLTLKTCAATLALKATGLAWRSALGTGMGLAQVGEFAFVLVLMGMESKVLSEDDYQRVVAIAVGSLILTPPLLQVGLRLVRQARDTELKQSPEPKLTAGKQLATVIGAGPIGRQVASQWEIQGRDVCLIDLSPINLHNFAQEGFRTVTGDATQRSILELAEVGRCDVVAVCVPQDESALAVVQAVRHLAPQATLIVRCRYQINANKFRRLGAKYVVSEEAEASLALLQILNTI
jgi:monovalent cation:H+ antiporter-2, CPA2 family